MLDKYNTSMDLYVSIEKKENKNGTSESCTEYIFEDYFYTGHSIFGCSVI